MLYSEVADSYSKMESLSGRNEITDVFSSLLARIPIEELPLLVYLTQGKLRPDYEGVELGLAEKMALKALSSATGLAAAEVRRTYIRLGDIGSAAQELSKGRAQGTLFSEPLTLKRVYDTLLRVARLSGSGSLEGKVKEVVSLLNDATGVEARYIMRTVTGVLRLGLADYTVLDAAASAFLKDRKLRPALEQAYNLHPDLGFVVQTAAVGGAKAVARVKAKVGTPIRPMLAERLDSAESIIRKLEGKTVAAEFKLDGERLQIHKKGVHVSLFSRRLEVVTGHYPDAVRLAQKQVLLRDAILEAEVVAVNKNTGKYLPFQELMHRRRKHGVSEAMEKYPIALNFFDILMAGSRDVTRLPYKERRSILERAVKESPQARLVPAYLTSDPSEMEQFMEEALENGCEGLVVKDPDSPYRAGAREFAWIKLKREYRSDLTDTLDLVIIGAFHGKGRRTGAFGTYLLGCYNSDKGKFESIAKVGTGLTDSDLSEIPKLLKPHRASVKPANVDSSLVPDVWFAPSVVLEIMASEFTLSPTHAAASGAVKEHAGISLRFPKFTGKVRGDKTALQATTTKEILAMYMGQTKKVGAGA